MTQSGNFLSRFEKYDLPNFGYIRLPEIKITPEEKAAIGLKEDSSNLDFLKALVVKGLKERKWTSKEYIDRAEEELSLINELGFVNYFILCKRMVDHLRSIGSWVDYGRGSVGGSLVSAAISLTGVDPVKSGLLFSRFLNRARASSKIIDGEVFVLGELCVDVDINTEPRHRQALVEYLNQQYPNRVSKINTFNCLTGKLILKEAFKVIEEASEDQAKEAANLISKRFGFVYELNEVLEGKKNEDGKGWELEPSKEFKVWVDKHRETYETALKLTDLIKNVGSHPSGYLIGYDELNAFLPLELNKDKELTCCYDMKASSDLCVKVDILSSRCSTVISEALRLAGLDYHNINIFDDPSIYDPLQELKTVKGLFQIEAHTNCQVCQAVKPKNLFQLRDVLALARPGSLAFLKKYVEDKDESIHPLIDPVIKETRYTVLFQEQVTRILMNLGFTDIEAEKVRKVLGKKLRKERDVFKEPVYEKAAAKGLSKEIADVVWKLIVDGSSYGFNASHSTTYASTSALSIYVKFNRPLEFHLALLQQSRNEPDPFQEIALIEKELAYFNIKLLPPDILKSDIDFKIEGRDIRYGLFSIRGISDKTIERVLAFRGDYKNKYQVFQAFFENDINIAVASALISSGCLQNFGESRTRLVLEAQIYNVLTDKERVLVHKFAAGNDDILTLIKNIKARLDEKGRPLIKDSRLETIKKKIAKYIEIYKVNSKNERMTNFVNERRILGYNYSSRIIDLYSDYPDLIQIKDLAAKELDDVVHLVLICGKDVKTGTSKKKTKWFKAPASDETGEISLMLFGDAIEQCKEINGGRLPQEGDLIFCRGHLKKDGAIFCNTISVQDVNVVSKTSEIKQ